MNGLEVAYRYEDTDIVELQVSVGNTQFHGTTNVYIGRGKLDEVAEMLEGFPEHVNDTRAVTLGAFGSQSAGGAVRLLFYCRDLAGHPVLRATVEEDYNHRNHAQTATILADLDPSELDRFVVELRQVVERRSAAVLNIE